MGGICPTSSIASFLLSVSILVRLAGACAWLLSAACSAWRNEKSRAERREQKAAPCQPLPSVEPIRSNQHQGIHKHSEGLNSQLKLVGGFRRDTEQKAYRAVEPAAASPIGSVEDRLAALEELVVDLAFKVERLLGTMPSGPKEPQTAEPATEELPPLPIVSASPSLSDAACSKQSMFVSSVERRSSTPCAPVPSELSRLFPASDSVMSQPI